MAKNTPAFQFYPSDFLGGVALLDDEQTGVYIRLLCHLWIQGNLLPFCFSSLSRATGVPVEVLKKVWPVISDKFIIENGSVMHARFVKMMEISEIRRESGINGGRPKKQNHNQNHKQNESKSESKTKANCLKNEVRRMKNEVEEEDWVFPIGWDLPEVRKALDDWAAMRKRINKPIRSKASTSKIFKQFASASQLIAVCEICEANEWQGLKPEYATEQGSKKSQSQQKLEKTASVLMDWVNENG